MEVQVIEKEAFVVIGKEGSTDMGEGFIQELWKDANSHFNEIQYHAKRDSEGYPVGIWGVMSDFTRRFNPWDDNYTKGLYLAGAECNPEAMPPKGWTRWEIPGYEYLKVQVKSGMEFLKVLQYMKTNGYNLVGAVHDFSDPKTGEGYMMFPIRKL